MEASGEVASGLAVGLASGTRGMPRKMVRRGFEKVFRRASGRLRKGSKGVFWAGLSRKDFRRGSFGEVISVGLGIDGWGSTVRSDRGELRSNRPKCLGRCGPLDFRSTARVGRPFRTDRTADRFLTVGSDLDGCYSIGGGGFFFKAGRRRALSAAVEARRRC